MPVFPLLDAAALPLTTVLLLFVLLSLLLLLLLLPYPCNQEGGLTTETGIPVIFEESLSSGVTWLFRVFGSSWSTKPEWLVQLSSCLPVSNEDFEFSTESRVSITEDVLLDTPEVDNLRQEFQEDLDVDKDEGGYDVTPSLFEVEVSWCELELCREVSG